MKKLLAPAWLWIWLTGRVPDSVFVLGKKTPWYRKSARQMFPMLGVGLMLPFALFVGWKLIGRLRSQSEQTAE
jgi:hypothetical protein